MFQTQSLVRLWLAGIIASVPFVAGCFGLSAAKDPEIQQNAATAHEKMEPAIVRAPEVEQYIESVGRRIIQAARELEQEGYMRPKDHNPASTSWMFSDDVKFHLVNSPKINAVTTGYNHMYVFNGFLQGCKSEEELAAVMAHEFAHVYQRHVQKKVQRSQFAGALTQSLAQLVADESADSGEPMTAEQQQGIQDLGNMGGAPLIAGMTSGEEDEADKIGFAFYTRAGWDPEKFADLFQAQIDKGGSAKRDWLDDHPALKERVENTRKRIAALPPDAPEWRKPPTASQLKFRRVQESAAKAVANMPQSAQLAEAQNMLGAFASCFSDEDDARAEAAAQQQPQAAPAQQQPQLPWFQQ